MHRHLKWLAAVLLLGAVALGIVWRGALSQLEANARHYDKQQGRQSLRAPETGQQLAPPQPKFELPIREIIQLGSEEVLEVRFIESSDTGVTVRRVTQTDAVKWEHHCIGFRCPHSTFFHKARVVLEGDTAIVTDECEFGRSEERVSLITGEEIDRMDVRTFDGGRREELTIRN